jgi:hypothetical protein
MKNAGGKILFEARYQIPAQLYGRVVRLRAGD